MTGQDLLRLRKKTGLSREKVAKKLKASASQIQYWEKSNRSLDPKVVAVLTELSGSSVVPPTAVQPSLRESYEQIESSFNEIKRFVIPFMAFKPWQKAVIIEMLIEHIRETRNEQQI